MRESGPWKTKISARFFFDRAAARHYYTRPMSPGPADQVNAKELSARAAVIERHLDLPQLERVAQAGGLSGTRVDAQLRFGAFDGRTTVDVRVDAQ